MADKQTSKTAADKDLWKQEFPKQIEEFAKDLTVNRLDFSQHCTKVQKQLIRQEAIKHELFYGAGGRRNDRYVCVMKRTRDVPCYKYNQESSSWEVHPKTTSNTNMEELKVVTMNVLFGATPSEENDEEKEEGDVSSPLAANSKDPTYTHLRIPKLFELLSETNAHVIALQEVEPPMLKLLLKQKWYK